MWSERGMKASVERLLITGPRTSEQHGKETREEMLVQFWAYEEARVYFPSAGVATGQRERRPKRLGGRTGSVDPRAETGTCGSWPGGR